jgi:magnesium chelatase family protein
MLARLRTAAVIGVEACQIDVEVDVSFGMPHFVMVGLPDASVRESRDRVKSAIRNSGLPYPAHRITVNLAPRTCAKSAALSMPIALGILAAEGVIGGEIGNVLVLGGLSLDGSIQPARGVLPIAAAARRAGIRALVLPTVNAAKRRSSTAWTSIR